MTDFYGLDEQDQLNALNSLAMDALDNYGLQESVLELLKVRENAVYKVTAPNGGLSALRVHRAGYHSDDALRSELQWMAALNEAGVAVPEVILTRKGDSFSVMGGQEVGGARQIDMFVWVDGQQLASVEDMGEVDPAALIQSFEIVGELAAQVHNQSSTWQVPKNFVRHGWDTEGLAGENPFWGRFWELQALSPEQRGLMIKVRDTLREELDELSRDRNAFGVIHADLVPENLLVDGDQVRLIDFDDAGYGWYLFEMATSLYFFYGEEFYPDIKQAYITGYRKYRLLSDETLAQLPLMFLARSTTYLGWVHTRSETDTAREMTPALIEMAIQAAEDYFNN